MSDLEDPLYKNWVRSALSLKYLKQGIHSFVDRIAKQHHTDLLYSYIKDTGCAAKSCSECTSENLLPDHPRNRCIQKFHSKCFCNNPGCRRKCPNHFCSRFYDLIVFAHDETNPIWANTDPARWFGDHWAMAKCFLGTTGYSDKHTAVETDASGLLSIILNNIEIRNHLDCPDNVSKARDIRNEIMHSTSFEVDDKKLCWYVDQMILVLQDKKELINEEAAKNAVVNLTKLKRNQIYISEEDVSEMRREALSAAQDGIKHIEKKTDEVMHRIEVKRKQVHEDIDAHFAKKMREQDKQMDDKNIQTVDESDVDNEAVELTAEEKDLQNYLVDLYRRDYVKVDISPLSSEYEEDVEEAYVPLQAERIRPGPNQSIDQLKDLFESGKNKFNNIFITGDAGIGKTTFCKKLISAWCRSKSKCKYAICKTSAVFDDERCSRDKENEDKDDDKYEMLPDPSYLDIYGECSGSGESENEEMDEEDKRQNDAETMSKTEQQGTCAVCDGNDNSCTYTADQIELEKFDFLFLVSLRDSYQERSIEEMIKEQLFNKKCHKICFSQIIENKPENCLVILDGLDEWQPPSPLPTHPAVSKGLPLSSTTGSYAKITTSRPWKTEMLRPKFRERDCEIKLIGIGEKGSRVLMENMMSKLSKSSTNDQTLLFLDKLKEKNIECLKFVPLLIKLLICIWFENGALATSKTAIYSSIINLMVLQAEEKYSENEQFRRMTAIVNTFTSELSSCLNEFPKLVRYSRLFQSVSKFAFDMLFRMKCGSLLVFKLTEIEQYGLTKEEIYLCLHFGILSQKSVFRDSKISNTKSLSFNHKTFQDYFAAMYLSINDAVIDVVCEFCVTISQFYEILSVLMFLGEMNQTVLYKILAKTSILSKFDVEVINHSLIVKSKHINLNVMELFMRANFHSIILRSMDFETSSLKLLDQIHSLGILELHFVRMTHKGMKELLQSIPESENGIILKITCLTWNDDFEVKFNFPMTITLQNIRKIDITGTDIRKIDFVIGNGNSSLESVKLYLNTMADVGLCKLINSIKPVRNILELTVDNTTLQKSVDVSHDFDSRLVKIVICGKNSRCDSVQVGFFKICTTNDPVIIRELRIKDTDLSDIAISFHTSQTRIELLEISKVKITTATLFSVLHATSDDIVQAVLNDVDLIKEKCFFSMSETELLDYVRLWCLFNLLPFNAKVTMKQNRHICLYISSLSSKSIDKLSDPNMRQINDIVKKSYTRRMTVTIGNITVNEEGLCKILTTLKETFLQKKQRNISNRLCHAPRTKNEVKLHIDNASVDRSIDWGEGQQVHKVNTSSLKEVETITISCSNQTEIKSKLWHIKNTKTISSVIFPDVVEHIIMGFINGILGCRVSKKFISIVIGNISCLKVTTKSISIKIKLSRPLESPRVKYSCSNLYQVLERTDTHTLSGLKATILDLFEDLKRQELRTLSKVSENISELLPKLKTIKNDNTYQNSKLKTLIKDLLLQQYSAEPGTLSKLIATAVDVRRALETVGPSTCFALETLPDLRLEQTERKSNTLPELRSAVSYLENELKKQQFNFLDSEIALLLQDFLSELKKVQLLEATNVVSLTEQEDIESDNCQDQSIIYSRTLVLKRS